MRHSPPSVGWRRGTLPAGAALLIAGLMFAGGTVRGADPAESPLTRADREHWSFQPPRRPELPRAPADETAGGRCRNPIDRFLLERLAEHGLSFAPEADRAALLRRVTFDLTGLPPTPEEIREFLADTRADAYERAVDRLLSNPAYGEHWAQHWLDLARFAETDGFEHDLVRPHAWRYRDWVIDALNRDLPYDEFVRLQLAGDLMAPDDPQAVTATGFLLCGPDMPDINDQAERRHFVLNDLTASVGGIFLGLQLGCAQCHDHKYDPLSQFDFYRVRGCFESLEMFREFPVATPEMRNEHERAAAPRQKLAQELGQFEARARQIWRVRNPDAQPKGDELFAVLDEADRRRATEVQELLRQQPPAPELPMGRVVREGALRPPQVWIRGDHRQPGPRVAAGPPRVLLPAGAAEDGWGVVQNRPPEAPARLLFAQWLTQPNHPTFARVMVNRVWQHHFRRPLAGTPSDFGLIGSPPSNARLLDWLACEFAAPESGVRDEAFRLKRLHRMLLTSAAYRQASRSEGTDVAWGERLARDPNFELLSRMERRRLTGEEIRDAMLAAGGGLAFDRGGPGVRPPLPSELVANLLRGQWEVSPRAADHRRRSVYLFVRRNLRYPLFEAFDRPDTNASCPVRPQSTTAPQALTLLNSEPVRDAARELAEAARRDAAAAGRTDDAAFVEAAWLRTLGRTPEADELARALQFLKSGQARDDEVRVLLCLGLFNVNEFVYVD